MYERDFFKKEMHFLHALLKIQLGNTQMMESGGESSDKSPFCPKRANSKNDVSVAVKKSLNPNAAGQADL